MRCVLVVEDNWKHKHIANVVSTVLTLCGFVDVDNVVIDGEPDCPVCLNVVRYCKKLRLRRTA
jgi:hypothetical protein